MKDSLLISVRVAKAFLAIMALMLLVFIVCYAMGGDVIPDSGNEFTAPHHPLTTRGKLMGMSIVGFVLAIPFSCALNALALFVNRDVVKLGRILQISLVIALIGFIATPAVLFVDENIRTKIFGIVAAVPIAMWLVTCFYLFKLDSKWKKIIPDDSEG